MSFYKTIMSGAISAALLVSTSSPAQAGFFSRKKNADNQSQNLPEAATAPRDAQLLNGLIQKISQNFSQLQVLMSQGQYQAALTMAKASLDEARMKTGIDPKSQRREIIAVPNNTFASDYKTLGMALSDFPIDTQNNIMTAVESYSGGYFLDLLNLLKRTNLIYIEAFYQTLKQSPQGLMQEDIQKIRSDINAVRAVPLYLRDAKSGSLLLVLDYEVANSDQNYLFNRELKSYLMSEGKALGYSSQNLEQSIDNELKVKVSTVRRDFVRTESKAQEQVQPTSADRNPFQNPSYKTCYEMMVYTYTTATAQSYCLNSYASHNYNNPVFSDCYNQAVYTLTTAGAVKRCERFATY